MDKAEFLNLLKESLSQQVSPVVIEQNIRYYDQYINSMTKEEEAKKIEELGDPRLIARTIIESEKAAKEKGKNNGYQRSNGSEGTAYRTKEEDSDWEQKWEQQNSGSQQRAFFANLKWYHKLIAVLVVILVLIVIAILGRVVVGILFTFAPIIIILLLLGNLFRRRR